MFLDIADNIWNLYHKRIGRSGMLEIMDELYYAEASLVNALACSSRGRYTLNTRDRATLVELIDQARNYIDHVNQEYL